MKANWDAAINKITNSIGLGGLIRDSKGDVLVSFGCCINNLLSTALAEALGLRKLLMVRLYLQTFNVIFEGNCLQVIFAANHPKPDGDIFYSVIWDIHKLLQKVPI